MAQPNILIVDDEAGIRIMLQDYLETDYSVSTCQNAVEALRVLETKPYHVVISDINMPGMKGYDLLSRIHRLYPTLKTMLITAYNVDDYIRLAKEHGIFNIIAKTMPFNFDEIGSLVRGLVTEDIFGIEKYLHENSTREELYVIRNSEDAKTIRQTILSHLQAVPKNKNEIRLVLDEIITNAIYHSPKVSNGNNKYPEYCPIQLEPDEYIHVTVGKDDEKICIGILDSKGTLNKEKVLYLVDRHIHAEGILDESGRGIFMSRLFADRIIINIKPGVKTEFIIIFYWNQNQYKGFKPLYINQL